MRVNLEELIWNACLKLQTAKHCAYMITATVDNCFSDLHLLRHKNLLLDKATFNSHSISVSRICIFFDMESAVEKGLIFLSLLLHEYEVCGLVTEDRTKILGFCKTV